MFISVRNPISKKGIWALLNPDERFYMSKRKKLNLVNVDFQVFSATLKNLSVLDDLIEIKHFYAIAIVLGFDPNNLKHSEIAVLSLTMANLSKRPEIWQQKNCPYRSVILLPLKLWKLDPWALVDSQPKTWNRNGVVSLVLCWSIYVAVTMNWDLCEAFKQENTWNSVKAIEYLKKCEQNEKDWFNAELAISL